MKKLIIMSILLFAYMNSFGQADLTVTSTGLNMSNLTCGITVRASADVKNVGNQRTDVATHLGYYLSTDINWSTDDIFMKEDYVRKLNPNNISSEFDFPYILAPNGPGTYYILYVADHNDVINESDETNNVAYRQINIHTCAPLPDLLAPNTMVDRTTVACNGWLKASATVENRDYTASGGWARLGYYLSTDIYNFDPNNATLLASDWFPSLAPLATSPEWQWLRIPANTPPGNYTIYFVVDPDGLINERHTYNNDIWKKYITVTCPSQKQATDDGMNVDNFPNPFSENTTIVFDLPEDSPVTLFVSDMTGKRVAVLLDKEQQYAGANQVVFDGSTYPAGTYYYTIQAGEYTATKKIVLMK